MQLGHARVHGLGERGHELVERIIFCLVLSQCEVLEDTARQVWLEETKCRLSCKQQAVHKPLHYMELRGLIAKEPLSVLSYAVPREVARFLQVLACAGDAKECGRTEQLR
jgi:hypothetical protein